MRWIAFGSAGLVVALFSVAAAPQPKDPPRPALYSATVVGTEWVYSYKSGIDASRVKRTIVGAEPRDGGVLVSIDREWDGKTAPDSRVLVSADGLLALPLSEKEATAPFWSLKRPVVRGQSWELPREGWDPPVCTFVVAGVEEVKVPAGTFEAVRVDAVWSRGGVEQGRGSKWYARDVGLVKWTNFAESSEVLVSFTPGKGATATVLPAGR